MTDTVINRLSRRAFGFAQTVFLWFARSIRRLVNGTIWLPYRAHTPLLKSLDDLRTLCNHTTTNDDGDLEFAYTTFSFITKEHAVYFGRSSRKLTLKVVNESLKSVANEDVYPEAPLHITRVITIDSSVFVKGPALTFYDELQGSGTIAELLLQEAEMLERIKRNPHANLIRYHGCQIYHGRIVGLVLERYLCTLEERMREGSGNIILQLNFERLKSGVMHLHSLGLAHNDIKAGNVMVSTDGSWILVDMGSCRPFSDYLIMAGKPEWETSSSQHDEDALRELWIWLSDRRLAKG